MRDELLRMCEGHPDSPRCILIIWHRQEDDQKLFWMPGDFLSKAHLTDQLFPEKIHTRTVLGTPWVLREDVF